MAEPLRLVSDRDDTTTPEAFGFVEAEAALLSVALTDPKLLEHALDKLVAEDFVEAIHGQIFQALRVVAAGGSVANIVSIAPMLQGKLHGDMDAYKYAATLVQGSAVARIGFRDFVKQIVDASRRRTFAASIAEVTAALFEQTDAGLVPLDQLAATLDSALTKAVEGDTLDHDATAGQAAAEAIADLDATETGVTCGEIPSIDKLIGCIRETDYVVLGGRPGMGKSAVALTYARGAAQRGHGVLFVSLEMSRLQCGQRLLADQAYDDPGGVPFAAIINRRINRYDRGRLEQAKLELDALPLQIVDAASVTIGRLNSMVRRWKRRFEARGQKLDLVIVDYLQKVKPNNKANSKHDEITEVSDGMKIMAKQYGIGVMALAQLSRGVEARVDKRPVLADLRESGSIEQDADVVLFVYRPEYYLRQTEPPKDAPDRPKWDKAMDVALGRIEFIAGKQRHGVAGSTQGLFYGAYQAVRG